MELVYKTLDDLLTFLESQGVNSRILSRVPNVLLYQKMHEYGFSDAEIINVFKTALNGAYGEKVKYQEYYANAIDKVETLVEFRVPYKDVNLDWFNKNCTPKKLEQKILRKYNTRCSVPQSQRYSISPVS